MTNKDSLEGTVIRKKNGNKEYTIGEKIDEGGSGDVWKAYSGDNLFALKRLLPEHCHNSSTINDFLNEGRVLQNLDHPHIIKTYDVGFSSEHNLYFIVMELMKGGDLFPYIQGHKQMDSSEAKKVIISLAEALDHAHSKVIHRDIHPGNILFDSEGKAVLTDFGMAKIMEGSNIYRTAFRVSRSGEVSPSHPDFFEQISANIRFSGGREPLEKITKALLGHRAYCSPEVWRQGGIQFADKKSDQFSLGRVAYELFRAVGDQRLREIAAKALNDAPEMRYSSLKELIETMKSVKDYLLEISAFKDLANREIDVDKLKELAKEAYSEDLANKENIKNCLNLVEDQYLKSIAPEVERFENEELNSNHKNAEKRLRELREVLRALGEVDEMYQKNE